LMRKLRLVLGVSFLVLAGGGLFLALRGPAPQPHYLRIDKGMKWDDAEGIMGTTPYRKLLTADGTLDKWYSDVGGLVRLSIDGEEVVEIEYVPDVPDPSLALRVARWLRMCD
jgi:hypothetical protein